MKSAYRVLAYLLALEVIVQAAAVAYFISGLGTWIMQGGVLDKAAMESESTDFTGLTGIIVHGINGQMVIPALAVVLLVVSFFAKVRGGVGLAAALLVMVLVQVGLGVFGHGLPLLGLLHGILAMVLFATAVFAARRAESVPAVEPAGTQRTAGVG